MPRFAVDWQDVLMALLREELPDVNVMSRIPDYVPEHLPLVVLRRTAGGQPSHPDLYDQPWVNVQCWADEDDDRDAYRAASDLADQVRGVFWTAWRTQRVLPGLGWLGSVRESNPPFEISDPDLPLLGRYSATYEIRVRPA